MQGVAEGHLVPLIDQMLVDKWSQGCLDFLRPAGRTEAPRGLGLLIVESVDQFHRRNIQSPPEALRSLCPGGKGRAARIRHSFGP